MQNVLEFIKKNKLIQAGERIGVGVSGGSDSMALVHFLNSVKEELDIEVIAICVDHGIREESRDEANFVVQKCKEMGVRAYKFRIDAPKIAKEKNISIETAAREGRYGIFNSLFKRDVVDKIALAHHLNDQAETILMHIFRGSGLAGARGMEAMRDEHYIRPLLSTSKEEILAYTSLHGIDYISDPSNMDSSYSRNFLRNEVMPLISSKWPGAIKAIASFGEVVAEDDDYINNHLFDDAVIYEGKEARIPLSYFIYPQSIISRIIIKALKEIGVKVDFEKKHIDLITSLAKSSESGKKLSLPFDVVAINDYDYLTLTNKKKEKVEFKLELRCGEFEVPGGKLIVRRVKDFAPKPNVLYFDYRKVPKTAVWRFREDGDSFEKFGGGSKKLKSYMIDKKIPQRKRDHIPVLADEKEVLVIAGVEISEKVKIENVATAFSVEFVESQA